MKCPICGGFLLILDDGTYICEGTAGLHVFSIEKSVDEDRINSSFLCLYPKEFEDNIYSAFA